MKSFNLTYDQLNILKEERPELLTSDMEYWGASSGATPENTAQFVHVYGKIESTGDLVGSYHGVRAGLNLPMNCSSLSRVREKGRTRKYKKIKLLDKNGVSHVFHILNVGQRIVQIIPEKTLFTDVFNARGVWEEAPTCCERADAYYKTNFPHLYKDALGKDFTRAGDDARCEEYVQKCEDLNYSELIKRIKMVHPGISPKDKLDIASAFTAITETLSKQPQARAVKIAEVLRDSLKF
ncbi:hypothetical protein [Treponema sp. R6D11]